MHITKAGAIMVAIGALGCLSEVRAQLNLNGYIEYQGRSDRREAGNDTTSQIGTLRIDGWSYLGKPWIGDFTGGIGLSLSRTREGELGQTGQEVTGMARLRLVPRSKLPFEAYYERKDSQIDGDLIGPSFVQTQYGIKQTYLPSATAQAMLNLVHTDQKTEASARGVPASDSRSDFAGLSISKAFELHQLDVRSEFSQIEHDTPMERNRTLLETIRHRYSTGSDFSIDTLGSFVSSRLTEPDHESGNEQTQWNSNLFWRPDTEKPSFVSATFLALKVNPNTGSDQSSITTLSTSGNYTYQWSPTLSLRSNAGVTRNETLDANDTTIQVRAGATYAPPEIPLGQYVYRYAVGTDLGYVNDSSTGAHESININLNHGLGRSRELWRGVGSANLNQQLATTYDTQLDFENTLAHSLTLDWNRTEDSTSTFLRFLASDTRRVDGQDSAFQIVNLQSSGSYQSTRYSAWTGNVTYQISRSNINGTSSPWLSSASAYVNYHRDRLFSVRLLRFTSELRYLSDDLALASTDSTALNRRETLSWTNRLDYIVGRTQMSLRGAISEVDHRRYSVLQFLLRRYFGRLPQ